MVKRAILLALAAVAAGCTDDGGAADSEKGAAALSAGDWSAAAKAYASAAAKNETNFTARAGLALSQMALGELDAAEAALEGALALDPDSAEARLVEGQLAYQKRDYKRAREVFGRIAASGVDAALRSQAQSSLGVTELAAATDDAGFDAARIAFWRALHLDMYNASAWYHLGVLSRDTFHFDAAALMQFEMFSRLSPPGDEHTRKTQHSTIPSLRAELARAAAEKPGVSRRDPSAASKLIAAGEAAVKKKQFKTARQKFSAACAADPLSYQAAWRYANFLAENDKTEAGISKALDAFRAAADAKPSSAVYVASARFAFANRRWATAAAILNRALAHDFRNVQALDLFIEALRKKGDGARARLYEAYKKEIKRG